MQEPKKIVVNDNIVLTTEYMEGLTTFYWGWYPVKITTGCLKIQLK